MILKAREIPFFIISFSPERVFAYFEVVFVFDGMDKAFKCPPIIR